MIYLHVKMQQKYTHEVFIRGWNKQRKDQLMCLEVLNHQERCITDDFLS